MKVRSHLVLMALVLLVPVILVLGYAIASLIDGERDAYLRSMREAARSTSLAANLEWNYASGSAAALSRSKTLAAGDLLTFYQQCKETNSGTEINTILSDADGRQLFNTARPYGELVQDPPSEEVRARVTSVIRGRRSVISRVIAGPATGQYFVSLDVPTALPNQQNYVLSQWFATKHLERAYPSRNIPTEWLIAIFDQDGRTISRNRGPAEYIGEMPRDDLRKAILNETVSQIRNTARDAIPLYTVFERSNLTGWTVAVGAPVHLVEASARRAGLLVSVALLAAFLFSATAVYLLGRRLVSNIERAKHAAIMLGRHEAPKLVNSPIKEIEELHSALHQVGVVLARYQAEQIEFLQQTREAQLTAEHRNKAKDDFLAMLGHELRNPLSAITAGISLISMPTVSDSARSRATEAIKRQCGLLTKIVDELLDASRVVKGKVTLSKKIIDLAELAQRCIEAIELRGFGRTHKIAVDLTSCFVNADAVRLSQVIGNLLENAFKFTPAGGNVNIKVMPIEEHALIEISDSGVGIDADILAHVFEVFVQGQSQMDRANGGLGIGLSVVGAMVNEHGGTVTAESDGVGMGSCFTVRLPLVFSQIGEKDTPPLVAMVHRPSVAAKILVIDDNADARVMLRELLQSVGLNVVEASTGQSGVDACADPLITTAIIDIGLPDLSGYQVATRVRNHQFNRPLRLIALTGYGQESDRERALAAGFDVFMTKPVQIDHLLREISISADGGL